MNGKSLWIGLAIWAAGAALWAQEPAQSSPSQIAGRSLEQWAKDLDHPQEVVQARAVIHLGLFGSRAVPVLVRCLDHPSEAVRYWACSHLGRLEPEPTAEMLAKLRRLKNDSQHPACALAAAYALCCLEGPEKHIHVLIQAVQHPEPGMALAAADFLGRLGPRARAAVPALEKVARTFYQKVRRHPHRVYHVDRAAENALKRIVPGWKRSWPDPRHRPRKRPNPPRRTP